jgi:glycine hydroxymethyltransferase
LDYGGYEQGRVFAERLQHANIIVDCAVRVGTCEITRRGMKIDEMLKIVELIKRAAIDTEPREKIKKDVAKLCSEFQKVEYCFD